MKNLFILTSGYMRHKLDHKYEEDFVVILTKGLSKYFNTSVIAPIDSKSKTFERIDKINIYFIYFNEIIIS